jgi:hypothetical protein
MFSCDEAPGSFLWICNALSLNPSTVRATYHELLQGNGHKVMRHRKMRQLAA